MTDKKFTDEEIINALTEDLIVATNGYSAHLENGGRIDKNQEQYIETLTDSINLINRQKAEIERLKGSTIVNNIMESRRIRREAKSEAYKEFADLAIQDICEKVTAPTPSESYIAERCIEQIDNLLKDMIGEEK